MNLLKYKTIILFCTLLFFPIGLVQLQCYFAFKNNKSTKEKLEKLLRIGVIFIFIEISTIAFLFYQFGRKMIPVMGSFY